MNIQKLRRAQELRQIVEEVCGLNIMDKNRSRDRVDARVIYAKILREYGYTYPDIGAIMSKDHTTIIHYCNIFEDVSDTVPDMKIKYNKCRKMFVGEDLVGEDYTKEELIAQLNNTRQELYSLSVKFEELSEYKRKKMDEEERFGRIYKLIRSRTPIDKEDEVERRINAMLNNRYRYQET